MIYAYQFFVIVLSAIVLQNAVFTRGLGSSRNTLMMGSMRGILFFGGVMTFITVASALLSWPLVTLSRESQLTARLGIRYTASLITLLCICFVFALVWIITRTWMPHLHYSLRQVAIPAAFNCAALGTILIAVSESYHFSKTIAFALGSGIGYTLALMLVSEGKRRISLSNIPRSFRGLPVMLLYVGILSLAIYGLIGHQLPT